MKKVLLTIALLASASMGIQAQRITDKLDRGLIAQKATTGVFLNWRILGEEYYDVQYNVYRDGVKINEEPLSVSNYTDAAGTTSSKYTVAPVVRGVEQKQSDAVAPWASSYKEIKLTHEGIASNLIPNDACCADVDGDGEVEILMKFDNESEMAQSYPKAGPTVNGRVTGEYSIFEILKQNGKRLWWVNCGPNMGDFQNNEQNIVGYDWNMDGKAEVIMRLEEGSSIHMADGTTYTIGANGKNGGSWTNYRGATGGGTNWFMCVGKEFLVYCDGETGKVLDIIDYPLARLESGETSLEKAWGDGYGHRASKFFFGAPYLDGKHPSIFLARGIYTQIKMCAFDVDVATNKLVKLWDWRQTNGGFWMWQGYHNFGIADVDEDGRDEIVYGSMVVDDNGKGLSTTGLGHGDAQHCGDFNPYMKGLEIYACNEDQPGNNYRDATTSKIYHRYESGNDDGRAMMDNFSDSYPGAIGCSAREGAISSVTNGAIEGMEATGINTNFRIYWDGDLCSETFNYLNGKNTEGCIAKYGSWTPIYTCAGSMTNNDTKGTPCYQGDILGDWREEIIMRTGSGNIRIYSTPTPTSYRIPTLWADHQYRNAMVWQMCGYNQPPHISYFIGKLEGITQAPPPLTLNGREEVANGGTIGTQYNDKHPIVCETNDTKVSLGNGVKPQVLTFNVPSWVQGTAGTNYIAKEATINYKYYTCDVESGSLAGEARLVKQGDGILNLPKSDFTHSGETNIWAGTLNFDGNMKNSPLWLNRFAELNSKGAFKSVTAEYGSVIRPGGKDAVGTLDAGEALNLNFGSRLVIDITADGSDCVKAKSISIEKKTGTAWTKGGPKYLQPVLEIAGTDIKAGEYVIAETEDMTGSVANLKIEGNFGTLKAGLKYQEGKIILTLGDTRGASSIIWSGKSATWDFANTESFILEGDETATPEVFVAGDAVEFNDDAAVVLVNIKENLAPGAVYVDADTKEYQFYGAGSLTSGSFTKAGKAKVTIKNINTYTGGNYLKGGTVIVSQLANSIAPTGNLGALTTSATKFTMENGAALKSSAAVTSGSPIKMVGTQGGVIDNANDFVQQGAFSGTLLTKKGTGWLKTSADNSSLTKLVVAAGTVDASAKAAANVEVQGTSALTGSGFLAVPITVAKGAKAKLTTVNRATSSSVLKGEGQITIYCATEKGSNYYATRSPMKFNMKNFSGTLVAEATYAADGRFTFDTANGSDTWTLNIPSGRIVQNTGKTLRIGTVTGAGTLGGGCAFSNGATVGANTWQVGNSSDFTFGGIFTSGDKFYKMGSGTMTTTGVWTSTGAVYVNDGTLTIKSGSTLGTGALTVAKGATLTGVTKAGTPLTNSSYTINGTLQPGATATALVGSLDLNGKNVNFNATSKLVLGLRISALENNGVVTPQQTYITNIGTLKFLTGATFAPYLDKNYKPTQDETKPDVFYLWTNAKTVTGAANINFELPELPTGNYWDTSDIAEGKIYVRYDAALGIQNIDGGEAVSVEVVNANGAIIEQFDCQMSAVQSVFARKQMAKGIYMLRVKSESGKKCVLKLMK